MGSMSIYFLRDWIQENSPGNKFGPSTSGIFAVASSLLPDFVYMSFHFSLGINVYMTRGISNSTNFTLFS